MPGPKARLRLDGADPINQGLTGWWPLNEASGNIARDISTYQRHGVGVSTPGSIMTPAGRAKSFSNNSYIRVSAGKTLPQIVDYTYVMWLRGSGSLPAYAGLMAQTADTVPTNQVGMSYLSGNIIRFHNNVSLETTVIALSSVFDGRSHQLAIGRRGAGGSAVDYVWLDGRLVLAAGNANNPATGTTGDLIIGNERSGTAGYGWQNPVTNFREFRRCLSDAEIRRIYADPWAGTARPRRRVYASPAPAMLTATIAGTVDITASVSAALALDAQIAGTVPITASATAALDLAATIGATVPITASIQAQLSRIATITGEIPITASIQATNGGGGDTHDGYLRRSRRQRALEAAERRREAERLADAQALRLELQAAMGMAADVVAEAPAQAVEAVQEAVAVVQGIQRGDSNSIAPLDRAFVNNMRAAVADLLKTIEAAQRAKALADDDEDVEILLRAL